MKQPPSERRCGNCDAFLRNKEIQVKLGFPQQGWCRANPPHLVQLVVPGANGQPVAAYQGMFTPTASDVWCRQWRAAGQFIDAEVFDATDKPTA